MRAQCEFWDGEQWYLKTIDQLFNYLVWRQNYGIIITFSKRKDFTEIVERAKVASCLHKTIIKPEVEEKDISHFFTGH